LQGPSAALTAKGLATPYTLTATNAAAGTVMVQFGFGAAAGGAVALAEALAVLEAPAPAEALDEAVPPRRGTGTRTRAGGGALGGSAAVRRVRATVRGCRDRGRHGASDQDRDRGYDDQDLVSTPAPARRAHRGAGLVAVARVSRMPTGHRKLLRGSGANLFAHVRSHGSVSVWVHLNSPIARLHLVNFSSMAAELR
jgi:hypothetical protein